MTSVVTPQERLQVIRDRFIVKHVSPFIREIVNELTLLNVTTTATENILLYRTSFMPGLEITDSDGRLLAFRPNEHTRILLEELAARDESYKSIKQEMDSHKQYVVWIDLPADSPIKPKDTRIIRLRYYDDKNPAVLHWSSSVFSIPRYEVSKKTPTSERYDTHYLIQAPEGFQVKVKSGTATSGQKALTREDGFYLTKTDRLISIRLPHLEDQEVNFFLEYDVVLEKAERVFLKAVVVVLLGLSTLILILSVNLIPPIMVWGKDVTSLLIKGSDVIGTGVFVAASAILGLLTNPLAHRTKAWLFIALMMVIVAFVLRSLGFTSFI
jgi:hypothetical protein